MNLFPTSKEFWLSWLQDCCKKDDISEEQLGSIFALFDKALLHCPHFEIVTYFLDQAQALHDDGKVVSKF